MNDIMPKGPDEIYCPSCAKPIKKEAVVCPNCGVQVKELKVEKPEQRILSPEEELQEGNFQLSGVRGYYWFFIVISIIFFIAVISIAASGIGQLNNITGLTNIMQSILADIIILIIALAIYVTPLVGIIKRKPYSVPFTRVVLILTMFFFPIGTIMGATLWKRINHPFAKKYLNYSG